MKIPSKVRNVLNSCTIKIYVIFDSISIIFRAMILSFIDMKFWKFLFNLVFMHYILITNLCNASKYIKKVNFLDNLCHDILYVNRHRAYRILVKRLKAFQIVYLVAMSLKTKITLKMKIFKSDSTKRAI